MNDWLILSKDGKPRYRKEILRVGAFAKESDGIKFNIDEPFLAHLVASFDERKEAGIKCPVPLGHKESAENNKGWVESLEKEGDKLFGVFDINGMTHEEIQNYDVSVFVPPNHVAGNGVDYKRPPAHVALTPYPVIPGLGNFEAIAASLVMPQGDVSMAIDFKGLGSSLGISDEMTEENASNLIQTAFTGLKTELEEAKRPIKQPADELKELALSHPGLVKLAKDGRKAKVEALMLSDKPKISKAVSDALVEFFCDDEAIALSLDETKSDFEKIIEILSKNEVVATGEQTGPQSLVLSDPQKGDQTDSATVADAKRRRKAAGLS